MKTIRLFKQRASRRIFQNKLFEIQPTSGLLKGDVPCRSWDQLQSSAIQKKRTPELQR
jgi:hypothetical protein